MFNQRCLKIDFFAFDDSGLCERRHFDTLNTLMKVQIQISGCFENLSFSHGCLEKQLKQEREHFVHSKISQN